MAAQLLDQSSQTGGSDRAAQATLTAQWSAAEKEAEAVAKANPALLEAMKVLGVDEVSGETPEEPKPPNKQATAAPEKQHDAETEEGAAETEGDGSESDEERPTETETPDAKRQQLDSLAKELGLRIVDKQVVLQERADFREEKRKFREARDHAVEQYRTAVAKVEPIIKARELFEAGDIDGALKLAWGKDLSQINEEAVAQASGVDLKTRREIQRLRDLHEQAEREKQELRAENEERARAEKERTYVTELTTRLSAEKDPTIASIAKLVPQFTYDVFAFQKSQFDPYDGTTITDAEAARHVLEQYRRGYESLHKVFGAPGSPNHPESGGQPTLAAEKQRNGKPPTRAVATQQSRRTAGKREAPQTDEEFFRAGTRALEEAMREDPAMRR